jgi:hypothetical protein
MEAAGHLLKLMGQVPSPQDYPDPPAPPCIINIHTRPDPPADHLGPVASPDVGPTGSGPTMQQAAIINVHPERERPR